MQSVAHAVARQRTVVHPSSIKRGSTTRVLRSPARQQRGGRCLATAVQSKMILEPTGDGSTDHLGMEIQRPGSLELREGMLELGREEPADLLVCIPTVSGRHAIIKVEGDKVSVTDLNSTNGTFIEGDQLPPMQVTPVAVGTEIVFGDMYLAKYRLTVVADEQGSPAAAGVIDV